MANLKLSRVAAVLAAAVVLAACGGESTPTNEASGDGTLSGDLLIWDTGLLGQPPAEDKTAKPFIDRMAEQFQTEHPGLKVKVVQQGGDITANSAQFQAASIAKTGPDIRIQYAGGPTLSFGQFFADLTDVIPQSTVDDMSGWTTVRKDYDPEGPILGMPYGSGLYFLVFYNKKMLTDAGLPAEQDPATWEEMLETGKAYKEATGKPAFWAANLEGYVGAWAIGALLGGELGEQASTDMYAGRLPVDDPAMVKVYQAWSDFGASGLTNPDAAQVSNGESTAGFVQGKAPFYLVGSWEDAGMNNEFGDGVGWFYIPMLEGAKYPKAVAGGPSVALSITNYAKNKEAAEEFLRFLAQPEIQDQYVALQQTEGSNSKQADASVIKNPLLRAQSEALPDRDPVVFPFDSVMPQPVIDLFYRLNAATFLGKTSAEDAAKQLQDANAREVAARK